MFTAKQFRFMGKRTRGWQYALPLKRRLGALDWGDDLLFLVYPLILCSLRSGYLCCFSIKQQLVIVHGSNFYFLTFPDMVFCPPPGLTSVKVCEIFLWGKMRVS